MTKPTTTTFSKFLVELGDGASGTEGFTAPCGFIQKGFELTAATSEVNVPDCDNPEAPAWVERAVTSLSAQITGSGVMAAGSAPTWRTWFMGATQKNVRVHVNDIAANGGGHYDFAAILTNLGHSTQLGSDGNKVQQSVTIQSTGPVVWTAATS